MDDAQKDLAALTDAAESACLGLAMLWRALFQSSSVNSRELTAEVIESLGDVWAAPANRRGQSSAVHTLPVKAKAHLAGLDDAWAEGRRESVDALLQLLGEFPNGLGHIAFSAVHERPIEWLEHSSRSYHELAGDLLQDTLMNLHGIARATHSGIDGIEYTDRRWPELVNWIAIGTSARTLLAARQYGGKDAVRRLKWLAEAVGNEAARANTSLHRVGSGKVIVGAGAIDKKPLSPSVLRNVESALAYIRDNPNKKAITIAKAIGLSPGTFRKSYVPLLKERGVKNERDGYHLSPEG